MQATAQHSGGAALLMAIFMVVMLTAVINEINVLVMDDVNSLIHYQQRLQARQNALTATDAAIMLLSYDIEEDNRNRDMNDYYIDPTGIADLFQAKELWSLFAIDNQVAAGLGLGGPMPLPVGAFRFEIEDLGAKYPLNRLFRPRGVTEKDQDYKNFVHFLEELGIENRNARVVTDSLIDWLDPDDTISPFGAESSIYEALQNPYRARNGLMIAPDEIRAVYGVDDVVFDAIRPFVTSYPNHLDGYQHYKININTAPAEVLTALDEQIDFDAAEQIVLERDNGPYKSASNVQSIVQRELGLKEAYSRMLRNGFHSLGSNTFRIIGYGFADMNGKPTKVESVVYRTYKDRLADVRVIFQRVL